jgi:replicative DNA helicase
MNKDISLAMAKSVQPAEDLLQVQQEMLDTINYVDEYAKNKGKLGGLSWGMPTLDRALEGLQPGLIIVAGSPNVGKSALCAQIGWKVSQANKVVTKDRPNKAYVLYFSLDDNATELLPRIIALDQNVPINVVKAPEKFRDSNPSLIARREIGIRKLKENIDSFKIIDSTRGTSIEFIEAEITRHDYELRMKDPTYKLVVIIDNFHDITVDAPSHRGDDNQKYDHIADKLSKICTTKDIPVICTAEFRKLNGFKRPITDDVRETIKIGYEAKAILLCYNEVGIRGEAASVYFNRQEPEFDQFKQPVFEVKIGKNKYGSYKGRLFYHFLPERSLMLEVDDEDAKKFNQMILA